MNNNIKRHRLLNILTEQHVNLELGKTGNNILGVPFEALYRELKCNDSELRRLSSVLLVNQEVGYYDVSDITGLYATEKGIASFTDKKYINENRNRIKSNLKDIVQIIIPILSLAIAFMALTLKIENLTLLNSKELQEAKKQINSLKLRIETLESNSKTYLNKSGK